ncbi:hypothetical protein E4U51_007316 [Claviceps purpurea]|nr:hypothetical protein E4U51_007316 [Claviceps purpurea]
MQPELTVIVAATRSLGIGRNGSLPWPPLRKEMQYFKRVTSRVAPQSPPDAINAVIMGRKTWDSIPPSFRPLRNRFNIVITRAAAAAALPLKDVSGGASDQQHQQKPNGEEQEEQNHKQPMQQRQQQQQQHQQQQQQLKQQHQEQHPQTVHVPSLDDALAFVKNNPLISRAFVIGGGQIYEQALRLSETKRVLLTRVEGEFECDTFFGLDLREGEGEKDEWRRCEGDEWRAWTGEGERQMEEEAGVRYEWQMWEKR